MQAICINHPAAPGYKKQLSQISPAPKTPIQKLMQPHATKPNLPGLIPKPNE
jgi:hypothetical protein